MKVNFDIHDLSDGLLIVAIVSELHTEDRDAEDHTVDTTKIAKS